MRPRLLFQSRLLRRVCLLLALGLPGQIALPADSRPADAALGAGIAAYLRGNFREAAEQLEAAADTGATPVGISALIRLGAIYSMQGRYRHAESALLRARSSSRQMYGERHPNTGKLSVILANVLLEQGRYRESELTYLQALQVLQPIYGTDHPDVAACLSGLAELSWQLGDNEESLRRFWRAYMVNTYLYGGESSKVSDLLAQLSKVY